MGHSFGGAIASMLSIMIRKKTCDELGFSPDIVTAVGYGTPPCVSRDLADSCSDFVTTVCMQVDLYIYIFIYYFYWYQFQFLFFDKQDDIIPRLSVATLMRLRKEILQTDW